MVLLRNVLCFIAALFVATMAHAQYPSPTVQNMTVLGTLSITDISGAVQCLQVSSAGVVSGAGFACGQGGGGTVNWPTTGDVVISNGTNTPNGLPYGVNGANTILETNSSGFVDLTAGGTGVNNIAAPVGALLIGNGSGFTLGTLTAGTNVTINNSPGGITINSTGGGGGGGAVSSVFGRAGNIYPQAGDYSANMITGLNGLAFMSPNNVRLTNGTIDGIAIGLKNPKTASFLGLGYVSVALTAPTTVLVLNQYQNRTIVFTGALTANATVVFPTGLAGGAWDIVNATTGSYTVTIETLGQSSPSVAAQGQSQFFYSDGVSMYADTIGTVTNFASLSGHVVVGQICSGVTPPANTYLKGTCAWDTPTGITPINVISLTQTTCGSGVNGSCVAVSCVGGTGSCTQISCTASTSTCTYTPTFAMVRILVQGCGQGGGAGGGSLSAIGSAATGGGAGGGAGCNQAGASYSAADVTAACGSACAVSMGVTGTTGSGGAAATTNSSAGSVGVSGGSTTFGPAGMFSAGGGGGGNAGQPSGTSTGGGAGGGTSGGAFAGAAVSPCNGSGGTGTSGASSSVIYCAGGGGGTATSGVANVGGAGYYAAGGGGSGGGLTTSNTGNNGGGGGAQRGAGVQTGATGGTSGSPNGGNATSVLADVPGVGAGGGYGNAGGNAGNGGAGTAGSGGGGGGSARNGSTAGAGGSGGNGSMTITEYFS